MHNKNVAKEDVSANVSSCSTGAEAEGSTCEQPGQADGQSSGIVSPGNGSEVNSEMPDWEYFLNRVRDLHGAGRLRVCVDFEFVCEPELRRIPDLFPYAELIGVDTWGGDCPEMIHADVNRKASADPDWNRVVVMSLPESPSATDWDVKASFIAEGCLHLVIYGRAEGRLRRGLCRTLRG
jgi:hypothetical protein